MERIFKAPLKHGEMEVGGREKALLVHPVLEPKDQADIVFEKKISLRHLINKLNNLNFKNRHLFAVFTHKDYPQELVLKVYPLPCRDERLVCRWEEDIDPEQLNKLYLFKYLHIPKGQQFLEVHPEIIQVHTDQVIFFLPEFCNEISSRKQLRQQCSGVKAFMFQHGATYAGELIDCSPSQFRIAVNTSPPQTFNWVEDNEPVTIIFSKANQTLYSGECRIIRHDNALAARHFTLEPTQKLIRRFPPKEFRSNRYQFSPPPEVVFKHPLFDKTIYLKANDISGAGFSVIEEQSRAILFPGLIIPNLQLIFSDGKTFTCLAQVIYCNPSNENGALKVHCGLTILNISIQDHVRLLGLIHQIADQRTYVSNKVDMDELWDFFFETGFIYPEKYALICANKEKIQETYKKLYNSAPSVAVHFIYRKKGRILAHAAALHIYEYSWLVHHHAAIRRADNRGGLIIANQAISFLNDANQISSMYMNYILCYFRPDNKFPLQVFGGAARNINNPSICSIDTFAYYCCPIKQDFDLDFSSEWHLRLVNDEDLRELEIFYDEQSGGLMLQGLHLTPGRLNCSKLKAAYNKIGLKRDRHIFSLRHNGVLCAIAMANVSDIGVNLSDLTNAITVIIVNNQHISRKIFETLIHKLSSFYEHFEIPVLVYPKQDAAKVGISPDKDYTLWVYNTKKPDPYLKYIKRLLRFIQPKQA